MIESGAEIALLKNNLMIKTLCRTFIFQSFNSNPVIFYDTTTFITTPDHRKVSVFNTCIYYLYLLGASKFARPL